MAPHQPVILDLDGGAGSLLSLLANLDLVEVFAFLEGVEDEVVLEVVLNLSNPGQVENPGVSKEAGVQMQHCCAFLHSPCLEESEHV